MKTTQWSLLLAGWMSVTTGCQGEEAGPLPAAEREGRREALAGAVGAWSLNASMQGAHAGHTATLLRATGDVLVTEGFASMGTELYNPYTNVWSRPAFSLSRSSYTATELPSGQVLFAGGHGDDPSGWSRSASLFDPATGSLLPTGPLITRRGNHTATLLGSGKVLVVGGNSTPYGQGETGDAEVYDPETGTWSRAGTDLKPRVRHSATLLYSGQVLVVGGTFSYMPDVRLAEAALYDPETNTWSQAGSMSRGRVGHLAIRLSSGHVMVLGGGSASDTTVEMFDPYNARWLAGPTLPIAGPYTTATLLYSGEVLVTNEQGQAALYTAPTNEWLPVADMKEAHGNGHRAVLLHTGEVLLTGGSRNGVKLSTAERFTR
jgi:hypothetical protein